MKLRERGQVTIPKKFRDRYGIKPNTEIDFIPLDEGLLIVNKSVRRNPFKTVYGILNKHTSTDEYIETLRGR